MLFLAIWHLVSLCLQAFGSTESASYKCWLTLWSHNCAVINRIGSDCWCPLINLILCCSWLYLGGALSSAMTVLLLMRLGSYFLGGRAFVFQAELYVGLLMFIGYVLFDTQVSLAH